LATIGVAGHPMVEKNKIKEIEGSPMWSPNGQNPSFFFLPWVRPLQTSQAGASFFFFSIFFLILLFFNF
jgi:hypothetical protein